MNVFWRFISILILLAALPARIVSAAEPGRFVKDSAADAGGRLVLGTPDTTGFPTIRFRLDAYNPNGNFIGNLKAEDIQIMEDQQPAQAQTIEKIDNGLQIIFALNLAPALANKIEGQSEYERIQAVLGDWARGQHAPSVDDFSLSTPTGLFLIRSSNTTEWGKAIRDYKPDLVRSQPSLSSLAEALDLATDPVNNPFMKRSIIYITPPLSSQNYATVPDLASRAKQTGAQVNVWLLAPGSNSEAVADNPLRALTEETGGQFAQVAPGAPLPDVETLLRPMRSTYQVSYTSTIQKSGVHTIAVAIDRDELNLKSNARSFELTVQPPNPIFLSPPTSIERTWADTAKNETASLIPEEVQLQILVEFPDKHNRPLQATRLYVNDRLIDENTEAPFDRFTWPVSSLVAPGKQLLRVEAVDSLGLTGASLETPVEVLVAQRIQPGALQHVSSRGLIAVGAVVLSGGGLALVLILTSRQRQGRRKRGPADLKRMKDPVTQPVVINQDGSQPRKASTAVPSQPTQPKVAALSTSAWPGPGWLKPGAANAPARLVSLDENEQPITGSGISLARQEITFGSDPRRATQLLESPTVDGLHARLFRSPEGDFFLADQGSVAGTWINYSPTADDGTRLEHGDLIHIGRIMFRFELLENGHSEPPEIKVIDLDIQQ